MPERDALERRAYAPTNPTDTDDPAKFGQPIETAKDAFVLELKRFFDQPNLNTAEAERRRELPTVRKYAVGFGPGTDPYETVQQIVSDFADTEEKLPHCAVTAVQGVNNRLTAGQPFIAHTQLSPRIEATTNEPYALGASLAEQWTVLVTAAVPGTRLAITINNQDFAYVVQAGDTTQLAARGLRDALRVAEPLLRIEIVGSTLTITANELNTAFTLAVTAGLTATQLQAAGNGVTDELHLRVWNEKKQPITEVIRFRPDRFATAFPPNAARADDVVRIINEQGKYVRARAFDVTGVGGGRRVRIYAGGKVSDRTPNEIEVLSSSTPNIIAVLGLGFSGTGGALDTIAGSPPDSPLTLNVPGIGTAAAAAAAAGVSAYVAISSHPTLSNNGRFRVLSVVGPNAITYDNPSGTAGSFTGATWFIGRRDDSKNPARPVMNRRHLSMKLTVTITVLAESPTERDELADLVVSQYIFYLEEKYFSLHGRGTFDPDTYPDEHYQISIAQDVQRSGEATVARQEDGKGPIHATNVSVPCTLFQYVDRSVLVPSGPSVGLSWTLEGENISALDAGAVVNP